jgi:hypothetical protein
MGCFSLLPLCVTTVEHAAFGMLNAACSTGIR